MRRGQTSNDSEGNGFGYCFHAHSADGLHVHSVAFERGVRVGSGRCYAKEGDGSEHEADPAPPGERSDEVGWGTGGGVERRFRVPGVPESARDRASSALFYNITHVVCCRMGHCAGPKVKKNNGI